MKIFRQKNEHSSASQNALPGVLLLLQQTHRVVTQDRMIFAGYAAWAIFPALATFGASFLTLSPFLTTLLADVILVGNLLLTTWITACLTLLGMSKLHKEPLEEREMSTRARKAIPVLLYLFAFSLFCIIVGLYLLVIPGILACVWLAFTRVTALQQPGVSFSRAIAESKAASKGRFFAVLWRLALGNGAFALGYSLLCLLVLGGMYAVADIPLSDLVATLTTMQNNFPAWFSLLLSALALPLMPYTAVYAVALYDALKTR